jgi:hypothetical protein
MEHKEIISGEGLGKIKFGMTRDAVKVLIGEPDEVENYSYADEEEDYNEDDEDLTELWHYDELELSLSFDKLEDWRLINMAVSSDGYTLKGKKVIGLERQELLGLLKSMDLGHLEYEDHSSTETPNHKLISAEDAGINFWLENEVLTEIQWGPRFKDDDSVIWPKQ